MKKILTVGLGVVLVGVGLWQILSKPPVKDQSPKTTTGAATTEINSSDWIRGNKDAPVTLIEYGDFQCPSCGSYYPLIKQLEAAYPDKMKVIFRNYPLAQLHKNAFPAAEAAQAAGNQGKFWEMHDKLFENQKQWSDANNTDSIFENYAQTLGLDVQRFKKDLAGADIDKKIRADQAGGDKLTVSGTPTFFVNGQMIGLPGSYDAMKAVIDGETAKITPTPAVHMHFDVKIYTGGKAIDLSQDKYMEKDENIHLHDKNGEIVHIHAAGINLGEFVSSLNLQLPQTAVLYVNGKKVDNDWRKLEPQDLNRILLSFGTVTDDQIKAEMATVTDKACIYSLTCPERGKPPTEKCVGSLGTDCQD